MDIIISDTRKQDYPEEYRVKCKWCSTIMSRAEIIVIHGDVIYYECKRCFYDKTDNNK